MPHVIWDCYVTDVKKLTDKKLIYKFLDKLPEGIGLGKIGKPYVYQFKDDKDSDKNGVTGLVIISESHSSVHTWPEINYLAVDIFSCKMFNISKAEKIIKDSFGSGIYKKRIIFRDGIPNMNDTENNRNDTEKLREMKMIKMTEKRKIGVKTKGKGTLKMERLNC